jgi:hypothetical protein
VDVVQKKGRRDRFGNRAESIYDEVDVVQASSFDRTAVRAELSSDRQPARQRASNAMSQDGFHGLSRSTRIVWVQQGCEHAAWYRFDRAAGATSTITARTRQAGRAG